MQIDLVRNWLRIQKITGLRLSRDSLFSKNIIIGIFKQIMSYIRILLFIYVHWHFCFSLFLSNPLLKNLKIKKKNKHKC